MRQLALVVTLLAPAFVHAQGAAAPVPPGVPGKAASAPKGDTRSPGLPAPFAACAGKNAGAACSYETAKGRTHKGTCAGSAAKGATGAAPPLACVAAPLR